MSVNQFKRFSSSAGFTLIEVLVALIIVSIGLLGLAGLQATSVRFNQQAYLRSQAVQQAYDMADRIRANARGMWDGNYDDIDGTESDPACISTNCSPADLADTDAVAWNAQNAGVLPNGSGTVTRDAAAAAVVFNIAVNWSEGPDAGDQRSFTVSFRP
jgi:type IV pilus assembly protein PilV